MNVKKPLELLRAIKSVAFASVDEARNPQVRIIDIMIVEAEKLYFVTSRGKEFHRQITANPNVALTGMTKDYVMVRLCGTVKQVSQSLLARVFEDNPSMNDVYPGDSRYILDVFCIDAGNGEIFDLSRHPIYRESFSFGQMQVANKGFIISTACVECGICKDSCPQQCVESGTPYVIRQENCLHCGLCFENCPEGAIDKR